MSVRETYDTTVPNNTRSLRIDGQLERCAPPLPIVNVVATSEFDNKNVDPSQLSQWRPGYAHNPARFAAVKLRSRRAMMLVFGGGRAVCPGANSVENSRLAVLEFTEVLLRAGYNVCFRNFVVQNIVCATETGFRVDIDAMRAHFPMQVEYKPDKFPGATFRMRYPKIVFNVFVSGRIICTGARRHSDSTQAWVWFYLNVMLRFRSRVGGVRATMNSAAYWLDTFARTNTYAQSCEHVWRQHVASLTALKSTSHIRLYDDIVNAKEDTDDVPLTTDSEQYAYILLKLIRGDYDTNTSSRKRSRFEEEDSIASIAHKRSRFEEVWQKRQK